MCRWSTLFHAWTVLPAAAVLAVAPSAGAGSNPKPLSVANVRALEWARAGAAKKLRKPQCQEVLADFTDAGGHRLRENLAMRGLGAADYVQTITFVDGAATRSCRLGPWVLLVARPGSGSVGVCPVAGSPFTSRLAQAQRRNPSFAEVMIIHEMLHTLGLGEDPPTSEEITRQVQLRCGS